MAAGDQRRTGQPSGPNDTSRPASDTFAWAEEKTAPARAVTPQAAHTSRRATEPDRPTASATRAPTATRPVSAAVSCNQGLAARENHTSRSPSGRFSSGAAVTGVGVGRVLQRQATTPAITAGTRISTMSRAGSRASCQSVRPRLARTMDACAPTSNVARGASAISRQGRTAGQERRRRTLTAMAISSQTPAGKREAAHSGAEPSGVSPPLQWVASRSGSRSCAAQGRATSRAATATAHPAPPQRAARVRPPFGSCPFVMSSPGSSR